MNEIWKKKNGKYLRINIPTIPDNDHLIKKPFAYWHTRMTYIWHSCHSILLGIFFCLGPISYRQFKRASTLHAISAIDLIDRFISCRFLNHFVEWFEELFENLRQDFRFGHDDFFVGVPVGGRLIWSQAAETRHHRNSQHLTKRYRRWPLKQLTKLVLFSVM